MNEKKIVVTDADARRLREMLERLGAAARRSREEAETLSGELRRASIVASREVPGKVVTMNTRLLLEDVQCRQTLAFTLVYPEASNADEQRVSVLSPVGTAVLGYAAGDEVEWTVPAGRKRFRIREVVYQPEAAGDYHL
jgi:regulator of nucleoside diphosphate kinase